MSKFRWSTDGGSTWAYVDQALPYTIPGVTDAQAILVEPIGTGAVALGLSAKTFGAGAASGTTIGNIGGVPMGVTAVFTPTNSGDAGKVAVSGTGASSKLVVGLTASAIGSIPGVVSAAGVASLPITLAAVAAITSLPALTTSGALYHAVYSNERLLASYSGALARDANGSVDMGSGQTGITPSDVAARRGSNADVRIDRWYDQAGAHLIAQATASNRPALHETGLIGGKVAMLCDGILGDTANAKRLLGTLALNAQDFTVAYVIDSLATIQESYYFEIQTGGSTGLGHIQYPDERFGGVLPDYHGNITVSSAGEFRNMGKKLPSCPQVMLIRGNASGVTASLNGVALSSGAPCPAGALDNFSLGMAYTMSGIETYIPNWRCGAFVAIDKRVNDTDASAIVTALMSRFGIPTSYTSQVVYLGTSRTRGQANSNDTFNKAWYERASLPADCKVYNFGRDAKSISEAYDHRAVWDAEVYDASIRNVFVQDDFINDLGGLGSAVDPASIYAIATSYSNYHKGLGSNVRTVIATTLPESSGTYGDGTVAVNGRRVSLNSLIVANSASASVVSDEAANATMGTYPTSPNDPTLYPDKLHQSSLGYSILAPIQAAAINAVIP